MSSSKEYLEFVLENLSSLDGITHRKMMGEYILYYDGKAVGGIYDDRLLLKPTKSAVRLMIDNSKDLQTDIPYEGAKEMLTANPEERDLTCSIIKSIANDLTTQKNKK